MAQNNSRRVAPLPLEYYRSALVALQKRGDVEFITYNDLLWHNDDDHKSAYPMEWDRWGQALKVGEINHKKCYVLIQHDADSGPIETVEMLKLEAEYGITSTAMLFDQWRGVSEIGALEAYPLDYKIFRNLESMGFCFGYHCNAFHNNNLSEHGLYGRFDNELASLREKLNIRFFSPHGGKLDAQGRGNAHFEYVENIQSSVIWVHNRYSPKFNSTFSDGGLIPRMQKGDENIDLLSWVERLKPGGRYRMLIHPQYYSDISFRPIDSIPLKWYKEYL